jgi:hypothetical protein
MSIIVKNVRFYWKASCYTFKLLLNYEKCFNTDETWHKCWLDHSLCNSMLNLKFPVTMATGGRLRIAKNQYLALFFPSKLISKCCNWNKVKRLISVIYMLPSKIDLRLFLACHMSKTLLEIQTPKQKRAHAHSGTPLMYLLIGGGNESDHFF